MRPWGAHEGLGRPVIFETGYGPSGLPHIGTFGEVARTTMVRQAFEAMTGGVWATRLICFSDDMDGLRKVPDGIPNADILREDLYKPLTVVRDPFGEYPSFGEHNNARLKKFLDSFGFAYEFLSSTDCYKGGVFDQTLLTALDRFDDIQKVMLPTLGARSPFDLFTLLADLAEDRLCLAGYRPWSAMSPGARSFSKKMAKSSRCR